MFIRMRYDVRLTEREVLRAIVQQSEPTSQEAIAESLDCAVRTVARAIKRLKDKGIVQVQDNGSRPSLYHVNTEHLPDHIRAEINRKV